MNITEFIALCEKVKALPYGRNTNRHDFSLVLSEGKGSCSSKHAFLKQVAERESFLGVHLILGMYKMTSLNTPNIGGELIENNLNYIPEAHCYLKVDGRPFDFTSRSSDFSRIENDILVEVEIDPEQVIQYKVDFHKSFLKKWMQKENINMSFDQLWAIRENCILNLSQKVE